AQLGAAAAAGIASFSCGRRPRVAILPTGDELRRPDQPLGPGQIYESNGPMLAAALARTGAKVTAIEATADTLEAHRRAFAEALSHDVVISTGGVSVGEHDLVRGVGAELGVQEIFWRIRMKPGKPLSFGVRDRTLVFGLPGNPVSALVTYTLFVAPALRALQGAAHPEPPFRPARLGAAVTPNDERDELLRVSSNRDGTLAPAGGQQSNQLSFVARADGLAWIPLGEKELPAGSTVNYLPLNGSDSG
ncbi:MAG: molybdopterin molybdotransferase MoeA, partial [Solirubrobacterales bacterium]|nr:molybdopterin molybdotransferase MoeA [Solirubrobacterales bacterium]